MAKSQIGSSKERKILDRISNNINNYYEFYSRNIDRYRDNREFVFVDQWTDVERQSFKDLQKPIFTYNKLYEFYKRAIGEHRNNTSNIAVRSINNEASEQDIEMRQDIIRGIEYESKADIAYQTAFSTTFSGGLGAIKIRTDYEDSKSFNQKIFIEKVDFPERVFFDPLAKSETKGDGDYMGTYETMSKEKFEKLYPDVKYPRSFPSRYNTNYFNWGTKDQIRIVEYYEKEYFHFTLYMLEGGKSVTQKEYNKMRDQAVESMGGGEEPTPEQMDMIESMMPKVIGTRKSKDYKITCYKAVWANILEKFEWPSKHFPIVMGFGDKVVINGEDIIISAMEFAKDPQRFLNFVASDMAQAVKNNRREQFMATPSNIAGFDKYWKNPANQAGVLYYNPDEITKQPPVRLPVPELPQTLLANLQRADQDIQSTIGFYDAMRGSQGQEVSGVALQRRQAASNVGLNIYFDNINRMQEQVGRIILSLLPKIYDTQRTITGVNIEGKASNLMVNQPAAGMTRNDLTSGDFDIAVTAGANYAVQKEQEREFLLNMAKVDPQTFQLTADLIASATNLEITPKLIERFKTLVPAQILAKEEGKPPPPPQPNPQAQMAQAQMQIQQQELHLKQQEQQIEAEKNSRQQQLDAAKIQLEQQQLALNQELAHVKAGAEVGKAHLNLDASKANALSKIINSRASISRDHYDTIRNIHELDRE